MSVGISGTNAIFGAFLEDHDVSGANFMDKSGSAYIFGTCMSGSSISAIGCGSYVSPSGNYTWTNSGLEFPVELGFALFLLSDNQSESRRRKVWHAANFSKANPLARRVCFSILVFNIRLNNRTLGTGLRAWERHLPRTYNG